MEPELAQINSILDDDELFTAIATALKVTRGRSLRPGGTVTETNLAYPTDSKLLVDGMRVLSRTLKRVKAAVAETEQMAAETFRDHTRRARNQARRIAHRARQRSSAVKRSGEQPISAASSGNVCPSSFPQ